MGQKTLKEIINEHDGNWPDIVEHIKDVEDPLCRLKMLNNVPFGAGKDVHKKVNNLRELSTYELEHKHYDLKQKAYTDPLTGLHTRGFYNEIIGQKITLAERNGRPLSLVFMDIDHFKEVNDTYGHPAGDYVLSKLGEIVKNSVRGSDICCRYGGEEVIVVLPDTDEHGAYKFAEYLRKKIEGEKWDYEGEKLEITVSSGVSTYDGNSDLREIDKPLYLQKTADRALYEAKRTGRNRVVVYGAED